MPRGSKRILGTVAITGVGAWLPDRVKTNAEWPPEFGSRKHHVGDRTFNDLEESEDPIAADIVRRHLEREAVDPFMATRERRVADDSMTSYEAEVLAARAALADADIAPDEVDVLLSHAMLPDAIGANAATEVARRLGTHAHSIVADVACASSLAQLEIACAYVSSGMASNVLCTQSHLMTRAIPELHPASPTLGDIATAFVVTAAPKLGTGLCVLGMHSWTHGEFADAVRWVYGRSPSKADPPWFRSDNEGIRLGSHEPPEVKLLMRETVNYGAKTIREAAHAAGIDVADIDLLCSVQPRGFTPGAIAQRLGLPESAGISTYGDISHVGASGPPYNLLRAADEGRLVPGTVVAMYAQGMGFTRSAAILKMT